MKTLFTALALLCALPLSAQLPPVFPEQMSDTLEHDTRMRTYLPPVRIVWTQNGEFVQTPEVLLAKGKGQMINAPYPHCILTNNLRFCWISAGKYTAEFKSWLGIYLIASLCSSVCVWVSRSAKRWVTYRLRAELLMIMLCVIWLLVYLGMEWVKWVTLVFALCF